MENSFSTGTSRLPDGWSEIPSHVPLELIVDIDVYNMPTRDIDPHAAWLCFKGKGPLVYSPYNGGHWIATDPGAIFKFFNDPAHFSSRIVVIPMPQGLLPMIPIQLDPPEHRKFRSFLQKFLDPAAVKVLIPKIRSLCIDLIEGLIAKSGCEFVGEFAEVLPIQIFMQMMNLPVEDSLTLRRCVATFNTSSDTNAKQGAHKALYVYLEKWIDRRIDEPGDDPISKITAAQVDGRPYTREEMLGMLVLLLQGGLDTVTMALSFIAEHLARNPVDREYIVSHPDKMNAIIQELLRRYSGPNLSRVLASDFEHSGVQMRAGDMIMIPGPLFNLDDVMFHEPLAVHLERENTRHLTFGSGPHTCAGAILARHEISIFLEEWLNRIPTFLLDPDRPVVKNGGPMSVISQLHLKW